MARLKANVSDVETQREVDDSGVPEPGTYVCQIVSAEEGTSQAGNDMFVLEYAIKDGGKYDGVIVKDYIAMTEKAMWKVKLWAEGMGLIQDGTGEVDVEMDELVNKRVMVRLFNQNDPQFGRQARVGTVTPLKGGEDEDEEDIDDDDDEGDLDEEETPSHKEVMAMRKTELRDLIKEQGIEGIRVTKKSDLTKLRERVAEELGLESDDEEDDDLEEIEDYAELSTEDLRTECKERGLETKGSKKALVKRLEEDDNDAEPF